MSDFIKSSWKIEFIPVSGSTLTLLDYDELTTSEPERTNSQGVTASAAIFAAFSSHDPNGGTATALRWNRVRSVADPRSQAVEEEALFPWGVRGKIRLSVLDGIIVNYERSAVVGISPKYILHPNRLLQAFEAALGRPQFPVFVASTLAAGTSGVSYSQPVTTMANIVAGYTVSIIDGALPTGLTLNGSTGVISGTPSATGTFTFTTRIVDGNSARNHRVQTITIT